MTASVLLVSIIIISMMREFPIRKHCYNFVVGNLQEVLA